jgi:predicted adenylyl cyclase CyaB
MPTNVEIKAKVRDLSEIERRAKLIATRGPQVLHQTDTFFRCSNGRMKLRDFGDGKAELIFYLRDDSTQPKPSRYVVLPVNDVKTTTTILEQTHGVLGVVKKRRTLYLCDRTRIHLDEVEGLGNFVELEVMLGDEADDSGSATARQIMAQLGIEENDLIEGAYFDLLFR